MPGSTSSESEVRSRSRGREEKDKKEKKVKKSKKNDAMDFEGMIKAINDNTNKKFDEVKEDIKTVSKEVKEVKKEVTVVKDEMDEMKTWRSQVDSDLKRLKEDGIPMKSGNGCGAVNTEDDPDVSYPPPHLRRTLIFGIMLSAFVVGALMVFFFSMSFSAKSRNVGANMSATVNVPHETFENIYSNNVWGAGEVAGMGSGTGSSMRATVNIRSSLIGFIETNKIQRMFDIPCGMMNWQMPMLKQIWLQNPDFTYRGMDIASNVINKLQQDLLQASSTIRARVSVMHRDVTESPLVLDIPDPDNCRPWLGQMLVKHCLVQLLVIPRNKMDIPDPEHTMVMSRQMLQHLSDAAVCQALHNFVSINAKFLLLDFYNKAPSNPPWNESGAGVREINLLLPPFSMPRPLQMLNDHPEYPRQMFVWDLNELKKHKIC